MADEEQDGIWESGWRGHEEAQLLRLAALPFAQKLEWLEQAQRLVASLLPTSRQDPR
jgi:hypothetical protein